MKVIECPSCSEMIPADSLYCDMCGVELLECVNCGAIGTGNFCGECSGAMVSRKNASRSLHTRQPVPPADTDNRQQEATEDGHTTSRSNTLQLKLRGGNTVIIPRDGALIGRQEGEYADLLKDLKLISRRHAKFMKKGRTWYLIDLNSTNGCLINDTELEPDVPMPFKKGDMVDIGTYEFDVI